MDGLLKGKFGAEQTGSLWAGEEKEQFLEEENKAHRQLYFVLVLVIMLIMVMSW